MVRKIRSDGTGYGADIHAGLQGFFAALAADVEAKFGQKLTTVGAIGISRHDARLSAL